MGSYPENPRRPLASGLALFIFLFGSLFVRFSQPSHCVRIYGTYVRVQYALTYCSRVRVLVRVPVPLRVSFAARVTVLLLVHSSDRLEKFASPW